MDEKSIVNVSIIPKSVIYTRDEGSIYMYENAYPVAVKGPMWPLRVLRDLYRKVNVYGENLKRLKCCHVDPETAT